MTYSNKAYVEHVAIRVKDIHWHIRFFHEVLGMDVRDIEGTFWLDRRTAEEAREEDAVVERDRVAVHRDVDAVGERRRVDAARDDGNRSHQSRVPSKGRP